MTTTQSTHTFQGQTITVNRSDYYGRSEIQISTDRGPLTVEVYGPGTKFGQPCGAQVNWSAYGSVDTAVAYRFSVLVAFAAVYAQAWDANATLIGGVAEQLPPWTPRYDKGEHE